MRLSEKTIELNICSQIASKSKKSIVWFGLTQTQEAKAGFDAMLRLNGRLLLFQFKASNQTVKGVKRFHAPHVQLQNLIDRCGKARRSIFYVLPLIGNTHELSKANGNLISTTYLLDVSFLPTPFPLPTTNNKHKTLRKSEVHYIDVNPPKAIIHSEPVETDLLNLDTFISNGFLGSDGTSFLFNESFEEFYEFCKLLGPNSKAAIVLD